MLRLASVVLIVLIGTVGTVSAQPPTGYAEIQIYPDGGGGVLVQIDSIEGGRTGLIKCGSGNNDRCGNASPITWSVKNNATMAVDVKFEGWSPDRPFPADIVLNNIQAGQRRPLTRPVLSGHTEGKHKYNIVVYARGTTNVLGRLDPEIDIMS